MNFDWNKIKQNVTTVSNTIAKTATETAVNVSKVVSHEVLGAQCLQNYVVSPTATFTVAGWMVYAGKAKKAAGNPNPIVSVWVFDKRNQSKLLIEKSKKEVTTMAKIKHPGVLKTVSPLEETRTQLVFLSEPVGTSLHDILHQQAVEPDSTSSSTSSLSELEKKHGLLQIAETMQFLHSTAGLLHSAVSPMHILITSVEGSWKLGGFGFAQPLDYKQPGYISYDYSDISVDASSSVFLRPPLAYTAPEIVLKHTQSLTPAADVFSLACIAYELTSHDSNPLFNAYSVGEYESKINSIAFIDLSKVPANLQNILRQMLAVTPDQRPPIASFTASSYFTADTEIRALNFLSSLLSKDTVQRAAFLQDLPRISANWNDRLVKFKLLPPLLLELRNLETQQSVIPLILRAVSLQTPTEFVDVSLPPLEKLLENTSTGSLLLLVENASLLSNACKSREGNDFLTCLLVRALSDDTACQQAALRQITEISASLDIERLQKVTLAVHGVCLSTTSATVRVGAFKTLASIVDRVDEEEALSMLQTCGRVMSVDKSAASIMCVVGLGDALAKKFPPKFAAERVLPMLTPVLVASTVNTQQFNTIMNIITRCLDTIERARNGTAASASGMSSTTMLQQQQQRPPTQSDNNLDFLVASSVPLKNNPMVKAPTVVKQQQQPSNDLDLLSGLNIQQQRPINTTPMRAPPLMINPQPTTNNDALDPFQSLALQHAKPKTNSASQNLPFSESLI